MAHNETNIISGFSSLVKRADSHHSENLTRVDEEQKLYSTSLSATNRMLQTLRDLREEAKKGSVSLKGHELLETLHQETIPLLKEKKALGEDFSLIPEEMKVEELSAKDIATLEDRLHELGDRVKNSRSHLQEKVWTTAHDHSMKLAVLCRMDPHESVRTMNSHMAQGK